MTRSIACLLIFGAALQAATITSNAVTGAWSAGASWIGATAPANGDTAVLVTGSHITADEVSRNVGTHDVSGTTAITLQGTAQLSIATGATLNVRGDISCPAAATTTGCLNGTGTGTLNFDTSASTGGTHYKLKAAAAGVWTFLNASNLTVTTNGAYAEIDDSDQTQGGMVNCTSCVFQHIRIQPAFYVSVLSPFSLTNTSMVDSYIDGAAVLSTGSVLALNKVTWTASTNPYNVRFTTDGAGTCTMSHLVADKPLGDGALSGGASTWTGCVLTDILARSAMTAVGAATHNSVMYLLDASKGGQILCGSGTSIILWQYAHDNTHSHLADGCVTSGTFDRVIMGSSTNSSAATDGFVEPAAGVNSAVYTFTNGLLLNQPNGNGASSFRDKRGENTSVSTFDHMTLSACTNSTAAISIEAETNNFGFGATATLTNSLFFCSAAGKYALNSEIQQPNAHLRVTDAIPPARVHNNVKYNVALTGTSTCPDGCTNTAGYIAGIWSVAPGTGDVTANPSLLDYTRTLETWASGFLYPALGLSAPAAWVTSHSYLVGDVVRNTNAGNPYGQAVYFRCIVAHTSAGGTEPGSSWDGLGAWWTDWRLESVERIADAITAGATVQGRTYIYSAADWMSKGFTPLNPAVWTAGTSGSTPGLVQSAWFMPGAMRVGQ